MSIESEDQALEILNALAPLSRKDEWWSTDGPVAVVARELRRMYPLTNQAAMQRYQAQNQSAQQSGQGIIVGNLAAAGLVR